MGDPSVAYFPHIRPKLPLPDLAKSDRHPSATSRRARNVLVLRPDDLTRRVLPRSPRFLHDLDHDDKVLLREKEW